MFVLFFTSSFRINAQSTLDSLLYAYEHQTGMDRLQTVLELSKYYTNDNLFKSLDYAKEGLALAKEFGDESDIQNAHNRMAIVYSRLGDAAKCNEHFLEAVKISMESENRDILVEGKLLNNIGLNYSNLKQEDLAIKYFKESIELGARSGDSTQSATLGNIAITYGRIGKYDSAFYYLQEAMAIDRLFSDSLSLAYNKGTLGEIFQKDNQLDSASFYLEGALAYFRNIPDNDYALAYYYNEIGEIDFKRGLYEKAKEHFFTSLELAKKIGAKSIQRDCYKGLEEVFEAQGNLSEALKHGRQYTILQDSLFREESAQKMYAIETSYQIKNKEQEISVLSAQAKVDELKFYIATGLATVIFLLLTFLFYRYQFKAKANFILQQKKPDNSAAKQRNTG